MTIVDRYELAESVGWLEQRSAALLSTEPGYICKACGGPAPVGVGYVTYWQGASALSAAVDRCPCGQSVAAV